MPDHGRAKFATPAVAQAFADACRCAGFIGTVHPEFLGCTTVTWHRLYTA